MNFDYLRTTVVEVAKPAANRKQQHQKERRQRSQQKKTLQKIALLAADPHCSTCGCDLVLQPDRRNTAHMSRNSLYCVDHVQALRHDGPKDRQLRNEVTPARVAKFFEKQKGRCTFCGATLTMQDGLSNSIQVDGRRLICTWHEPKHGKPRKVKRPRANVSRPVASPRPESWFVEGQRFATLELAESRATELANICGSTIDILSGIVNRGSLKRVEIVYPTLQLSRVG